MRSAKPRASLWVRCCMAAVGMWLLGLAIASTVFVEFLYSPAILLLIAAVGVLAAGVTVLRGVLHGRA